MKLPPLISSLWHRTAAPAVLLAFFLASAAASAQIITTVAGDGSLGDGGAATSATLSLPVAVAVDSAGNLYIADSNNNRIRKVNTAGVISTVAGNGAPGYYGDGGPAASAALNDPFSVAVDSIGDLYIADSGNSVIRRVDTVGTITTIAGDGTAGYSGDGGPAVAAELNSPTAVAVDSAFNIYIADSLNNRIRKVNAAGVMSTVAGDGTAGYSGDGGLAASAALDYPDGVALDGAGDLYIADYNNDRVREVNLAGEIGTLAGNGSFGFSGDGSPAASAQLDGPAGVAVDSAGNLYIADFGNDRVRRVNAAGIISTAAGSNIAGFSGDGGPATSAALFGPVGLAVDGAGNLYIADEFNARIREVNPAGMIGTVAGDGAEAFSGDGGPAASAQLHFPSHAVPDGVGDFYIADFANDRIRKVNAAGLITTVAGNGVFGFSGDGGSAASAELYGPNDVALDSAGNLYIADLENNRVRQVNTAGIINTIAGDGTAGYSGDGGPASSAELSTPTAVAVDGAGNLYIADSANNRIRKVTVAGEISTLAGNGTAGYSGDGGPAISAELNFPGGVALDAAGNLYIADAGNNRIRKVNTAGVISTVAGNGEAGFSGDDGPATSAAIDAPAGVAVDSAGNVYIADTRNNRVRQVNAAGVIGTVAGAGVIGFSGDGGLATLAELWNPSGVALDSAANLYIADTGNNRIREVSAASSITTVPASLFFSAAVGGNNPSSQTVSLSSSGTGTLNWTATASTNSGGNWLSVSPGSGTNSGTLTVSVNIAGLTAGTYSGTISLAAQGTGNTLQNLAVTLSLINSPGIFSGGVVNAASFAPGAAVAPGSIAAIFGAGLVQALASATAVPLPITLGNVSVTMNGVPAPLFFVAGTQINVQIPWQLTGQSQASVVASISGAAVAPVNTLLAPAAPGIFTINSQGTGQGAIIDDGPVSLPGDFAAPAGSVPGGNAQPAAPGDLVTIYCTGLGSVTDPPATGAAGNGQPTTASPIVTIGGLPSTVSFSGLVPTLVGEYQINVQVPNHAPAGDAVPVSVSIDGASSNTATMAIQ